MNIYGAHDSAQLELAKRLQKVRREPERDRERADAVGAQTLSERSFFTFER